MKKEIPTPAIKDIVWMARRYADGRKTYAPSMFNDAYDALRSQGYTEDENADEAVKSYPYASYGDGNDEETPQ